MSEVDNTSHTDIPLSTKKSEPQVNFFIFIFCSVFTILLRTLTGSLDFLIVRNDVGKMQ